MQSALTAAVSVVVAMPGYAQQDAGTPELEEINVTGSRIRQTSGFTTPVPVTTMTPVELFDMAPGSSVAEQLDALPQFFGNTSIENVSTGTVSISGSTSLDLRNLSGNRTLVLFDGYRVVPSSKEGTTNVDFFPTALVRSVDVVTGGASAAYGADAVGGVTNFVVDREFEGFKFNASSGVTERGDGERWDFSVAGGIEIGERLNVIGSLEAREIDGFFRAARDIPEQNRVGWVTNPEWQTWRRANPTAPLSASPVPQRLTLPNVHITAHSPYGLITNTGTELDGMRFTPDGEGITPFRYGDVTAASGPGATQSTSGGPEYSAYNDANGGGIGGSDALQRSGFLGLQYQVNDTLSLFGQAIVGRTRAWDVLERGGVLHFGGWSPTIYVENPFLPDNVRQIMIENDLSSFNLQKNGTFVGVNEAGYNRENSKTIDTASYSAGFELDLPFRDWHVRGVYQTGESERENIFGANFRIDRYYLAADAVRDPDTGAIVCNVQLYNPTPDQLANSPAVQGRISPRSAPGAINPGDPGAIPLASPIGLDNTVRDCVPFNILGIGEMSDAALDYIHGEHPKKAFGTVDQDFAELLLTGEAHEGWGYGPVNFAAGLTWREQSFKDRTYPIDVTSLGPALNDPNLGIRGIPPGYTGASPNLHYNSTLPEIEGDAKVWEWFGEVSLPVWEGAMWGQEQNLRTDLAFRRSDYARSGPVDSWKWGVDFQVLDDVRLRYTKSRDVREPTFAELFDAQGTNGQFLDPRNNNAEVQNVVLRGGNPNLSPEEASTVTAGVVWTPASLLEGLQISVDWYDVTIDGAVSLLGTQRIVDECFINNVQSLCNQLEINSAGHVTRIHDTYLNVAEATVSGTDLEVAYRFEPDFFQNETESLSLRALAGYLKERSNTPLGGVATDVSGSSGNPDLTAVVTASYRIGPLGLQLQGRYTDSVRINNNWVEGIDVDDNSRPSISWWNAQVSYNGETATGGTWRVGLNVQNLFDGGLVVVPSVNTRFPVQGFTGDTLGRRYNLNVNYSF